MTSSTRKRGRLSGRPPLKSADLAGKRSENSERPSSCQGGSGFIHDKAHQDLLLDLIWTAILQGLRTPDGLVILRTGDVFEVLTKLQAMVIATSAPVSTPTKRREFCADHGKKLASLIQATQATYVRDGTPFQTVNIEGGLH